MKLQQLKPIVRSPNSVSKSEATYQLHLLEMMSEMVKQQKIANEINKSTSEIFYSSSIKAREEPNLKSERDSIFDPIRDHHSNVLEDQQVNSISLENDLEKKVPRDQEKDAMMLKMLTILEHLE